MNENRGAGAEAAGYTGNIKDKATVRCIAALPGEGSCRSAEPITLPAIQPKNSRLVVRGPDIYAARKASSGSIEAARMAGSRLATPAQSNRAVAGSRRDRGSIAPT